MMNETTSPTEAPDALYCHWSSNFMPVQASGAFDGLKGGAVMSVQGDSALTLNEIRVEKASSVAEAKDGFPVANLGADVFELYGSLMVAEGRITETRMRRAVEAHRKIFGKAGAQ
jgi:hypothetical protein